MFQNEIFVGEFFPINGFATSSVVICEVTTLAHLLKQKEMA